MCGKSIESKTIQNETLIVSPNNNLPVQHSFYRGRCIKYICSKEGFCENILPLLGIYATVGLESILIVSMAYGNRQPGVTDREEAIFGAIGCTVAAIPGILGICGLIHNCKSAAKKDAMFRQQLINKREVENGL